jgi:peroxiredoxin
VRPFGISLDSPWSHRAWAQSLGIQDVPLLSDREGDAATGFGVLGDFVGMRKADRSAFLIDGATVRASWMLGSELPDVDAIVAAATSHSP